jgi:hypothetical protein
MSDDQRDSAPDWRAKAFEALDGTQSREEAVKAVAAALAAAVAAERARCATIVEQYRPPTTGLRVHLQDVQAQIAAAIRRGEGSDAAP